ncbi:MAG: hypothetical protein A2918_00850 [Candidatus Yanofskybacteria bacterium RIFCSPLOWO2_01_FULL_42_49]|uniref:Uncharacterized protein n=1 Tax=Candidatus Yanofskybacteria bacterium RIFCSPLOWO2_01_FULL_42_49 TaxID=1802694 RepID=A0A1F8GE54_9BACT|nr:MAG: hypothetical protein A2918_00850 [Candidatus Yanofskybacteria bacterium RIFCSPLOWO2_01_FULL_42_49]
MDKEFDKWNGLKKEIHSNDEYLPLYHERQIRWCRLGANVGFEQDGTGKGFSRPVLILKGFSRHVCLVIPLTTSAKKNMYHIPVGVVDSQRAAAVISQVRLIDTKRLYKLIGTLDKKIFDDIRKAVKNLI